MIWITLIFGGMWLSVNNLPDNWVGAGADRTEIMEMFLINPVFLISMLLLFWVGFEWAFIPLFLSMFVIGLYSSLEPQWAILFSLSFVFGLGIYSIVYNCITIRYDLRSLSSIAVFVVTSFIAATASSLGAFIYSLSHELSANQTATLWNGWWTGAFLQAVVIAGPLLFVGSSTIEKLKNKLFEVPERPEVSIRWVYTAVIVVTAVICIFIFSGDYLGKEQVAEQLIKNPMVSGDLILSSLESFEIITYVSIWVILCVGIGGIFLIGTWNKQLKENVEERTRSLKDAEEKIMASLEEKEVLLKEIHHRVKNNLAVVTALLDLQYMRAEEDKIRHILSDSKSRIKSMAFVHETLYQTEDFSKIDLQSYLDRLTESVTTTFMGSRTAVDVNVLANDNSIEMNKAISIGLIVNELLVNSFKHAFDDMDQGLVVLQINQVSEHLEISYADNGSGFDMEVVQVEKPKSLGMTLIKTLTKQLNAELKVTSRPGKTVFKFHAPLENVMGEEE
ncbi:histidine kinase dimerization/phosphoacceptor domain -containing protein [Balneola sp. MJW-20]|uniref:histidine kinase dimerization/phosphoacceptor domain -containing protein n=1 Tax=Gracilimonas aurantiaca TaxID=3234185 RepID=UPI00390B1F61